MLALGRHKLRGYVVFVPVDVVLLAVVLLVGFLRCAMDLGRRWAAPGRAGSGDYESGNCPVALHEIRSDLDANFDHLEVSPY